MPRYAIGERGEYASSPFDMPWRAWRQVAGRVWQAYGATNISIVSAGVAFYGFLSLFPALAALVMVYGLIADPSDVRTQIGQFRDLMPGGAAEIIETRLQAISGSNEAGLSFGLLFALGFALWSATKGVKALITAMNVAYREEDRRGVIWQNAVAVLLTFGSIVFFIVAMTAIAVVPAAVAVLQPRSFPLNLLIWSRWLVLACLVAAALTLLYRYAAHRDPARVVWLAPGAALASVLWLLLSLAFSFYVQNFGNYNEMFGPLSAVVVLLMWLYLSAVAMCLGALLNAELEFQTYRDSTVGIAHRAGLRGAYVADETWEP